MAVPTRLYRIGVHNVGEEGMENALKRIITSRLTEIANVLQVPGNNSRLAGIFLSKGFFDFQEVEANQLRVVNLQATVWSTNFISLLMTRGNRLINCLEQLVNLDRGLEYDSQIQNYALRFQQIFEEHPQVDLVLED